MRVLLDAWEDALDKNNVGPQTSSKKGVRLVCETNEEKRGGMRREEQRNKW